MDHLLDRLADEDWLNELLARADPPHGSVAAVRIEPIGGGFGLSGQVRRITARSAGGEPVTIVAKVEDAERTSRAVAAHRRAEPVLGSSMARCLAAHLDGDDGLLLLEDLSPAEQGDELEPCDRARATEVVRVVATLHANTAEGDGTDAPSPERWQGRVYPPDWWTARGTVAADRYRGLIELDRLWWLRERVAAVVSSLNQQPVTWIHVDPHLDNIMWRPDGSPVLIDWSNARIGPPAADLAVLLATFSFPERPALKPDGLLAAYAAAVHEAGEHDQLADNAAQALAVQMQGVLGWLGEASNEGFHDRKRVLRDDVARRFARALGWLESVLGHSPV